MKRWLIAAFSVALSNAVGCASLLGLDPVEDIGEADAASDATSEDVPDAPTDRAAPDATMMDADASQTTDADASQPMDASDAHNATDASDAPIEIDASDAATDAGDAGDASDASDAAADVEIPDAAACIFSWDFSSLDAALPDGSLYFTGNGHIASGKLLATAPQSNKFELHGIAGNFRDLFPSFCTLPITCTFTVKFTPDAYLNFAVVSTEDGSKFVALGRSPQESFPTLSGEVTAPFARVFSGTLAPDASTPIAISVSATEVAARVGNGMIEREPFSGITSMRLGVESQGEEEVSVEIDDLRCAPGTL